MSVDPRKIKMLSKLAEYGADTEKKITALGISDLLEICEDSKALAISEIKLIMDFQEAIKVRRGIAFLLDAKEDPKEESKEKEEKKDGNDKGKPIGKGRNNNLEFGGTDDVGGGIA